MARFFAKQAGARVMVQGYGEATAETFVEVPESVAAELSNHPGLVQGFDITLHGNEAVIPVAKPKETPKRNPSPAKGEKE